jgi:hypothetical protein
MKITVRYWLLSCSSFTSTTLCGLLLMIVLLLVALTACGARIPQVVRIASATLSKSAVEQPVTTIPLKGPLSRRKAQLSGLAWYGDSLILLPQYPDRFKNQLFYLTKQDIINFLQNGTGDPLRPRGIPFVAGDLMTLVPGFQGFESIAFAGERAFLTIEAETDQGMMGYLVSGTIAPELTELRLDSNRIAGITPQTKLDNLSDEAIVLAGDQVVTLYEVNGSLINWSPVAHLFNMNDLQPLGTIPFPLVDFRITDATSLDESNRFWAINSFSPGSSALRLGLDPLASKYGIGPTHRASSSVERLVEFQYSPTGITLVDAPPVQLQLLEHDARNWEGIVRFESPDLKGFLLVTDQRPETILAFVPSIR